MMMTKTKMKQEVKENPILKKVLNYLLGAGITPEYTSERSISFFFDSKINVNLTIYYDHMDTRWSDNLSISLNAKEKQFDVIDKEFENTKFLQEILNYTMYMNFISSYGKWIYRPQNYKIDFEYRMAIHDGKIAKEQFLTIFEDIVRDEIIRFEQVFSIAKTGKIPKIKDDMAKVYFDMLNIES